MDFRLRSHSTIQIMLTCVVQFQSSIHHPQAYRVSSYFSAKTLADTPLTLGTPLLHCIILYFMVGLNTVDASRFFLFLFFTLINIATAQSFGIMISAAAPSLPVAQALAPTITILLMCVFNLLLLFSFSFFLAVLLRLLFALMVFAVVFFFSSSSSPSSFSHVQ